MGHTKHSQRITRRDLNEKLRLSVPGRDLLEQLAVECASDPSPDKVGRPRFALSRKLAPWKKGFDDH